MLTLLAIARATSTSVVDMCALNCKVTGKALFTVLTLKEEIKKLKGSPHTSGSKANKSDLAQELSNLRREMFAADTSKKASLTAAATVVPPASFDFTLLRAEMNHPFFAHKLNEEHKAKFAVKKHKGFVL